MLRFYDSETGKVSEEQESEFRSQKPEWDKAETVFVFHLFWILNSDS